MAASIGAGEIVSFVSSGGTPVTVVRTGGIYLRVIHSGGKPVTFVRNGGTLITVDREANLPQYIQEELGY
jgi:hypothetical protein